MFILTLAFLAGNVQARKEEDDDRPINSAAVQTPGSKLRGDGSVDDTQSNARLSTSSGTSTATSTATNTLLYQNKIAIVLRSMLWNTEVLWPILSKNY